MEWGLFSKSNPKKVLKWFGPKKPSKKEVAKEERRVHSFANYSIRKEIAMKKIAADKNYRMFKRAHSNEIVSRFSGSRCGMCGEPILKGDVIENRDWDSVPYGERGVLTRHAAKWQHRKCRHPLDYRNEAERHAASPEGKAEAAERRRKRDAEARRQGDVDERALVRAKRKLKSGKISNMSVREMRMLDIPGDEIRAEMDRRDKEKAAKKRQEQIDRGEDPDFEAAQLERLLKSFRLDRAGRDEHMEELEAERKKYRYVGEDWRSGKSKGTDWERED